MKAAVLRKFAVLIRRRVLRPVWAMIALSGIMGAMVPSDVTSKIEYVIGGTKHPWQESGSFELIDLSTGGIQPLRTDPNENLAVGYKERGGYVSQPVDRMETGRALPMFDGDPTTVIEQAAAPGQIHGVLVIIIDLGGRLPVNRIQFYPREGRPHLFLSRFQLFINDGLHLDPTRRPIWTTVLEATQNREPLVEVQLPLQFIRYAMLRAWLNKDWEIAEMEIFGEGYVPKASYTSNIMDLGGGASFGKIRWSGTKDPEAKVFIQTRSGLDDDPNIYWRRTGGAGEIVNISESGELLTRRSYSKLPKLEQGPTTYDTDNWSFWSAPYDFEDGLEGVSIISPGPRRYFQIKVDFLSTVRDGATIDFIGFDLSSPPAARDIVAEIHPLDVEPGKVTTFTYALRPTIGLDNPGFDSLEILTPVRADSIRAVRIEGVDVNFTVEFLDDPTRFIVHFPDDRMDALDDGKLLEVVFDAVVLRYGTAFDGRVFDSTTEEVPQLVNPGDATYKLWGDDVSVRTVLGGSLIASVDISPNPFTPNGDGLNDEVEISYSLLRLTGLAPVWVDIYDLCGRIIKRVYSGQDISGRYSAVWDGRDDVGEVVPPGIYLYRISVDADSGEEHRAGAVAVAY